MEEERVLNRYQKLNAFPEENWKKYLEGEM